MQRLRSALDSSRAEEHELRPLTEMDSDGEMSLDGSPRVADSPAPGLAKGLQGRKFCYTGNTSDLQLSWPANADSKVKGRPGSTSPPASSPTKALAERLRRAAQQGASQMQGFTDRKLQGLRDKRRGRGGRTMYDDRFDALARLHGGEDGGSGSFNKGQWQSLYNRSHALVEAVVPQLCSHLLVHASSTMRWPEDDDPLGGAASTTRSGGEPEPEHEQVWVDDREDTPAAPLPAGWAEFWDDEHHAFFYYHAERDESTWDRPTVSALPLPTDRRRLSSAVAAAQAAGGAGRPTGVAANAYYSLHHPRKYYYCERTGESVWQKPNNYGLGGWETVALEEPESAVKCRAYAFRLGTPSPSRLPPALLSLPPLSACSVSVLSKLHEWTNRTT